MNFYNFLKNFDFQKRFALAVIKFYQATFSYFLGGHCRHYPTCSHYAVSAYENFPFLKATKLVVFRVSSCHPLSKKSFFDPIPISRRKELINE